MKLGTETGSLVNHIYSVATKGQPEPTVGMGATILGWTDRNAVTITDVFTAGKRTYITAQQDHAKRIDTNGMSESQDYEYTPNPNGALYNFRQNPTNGRWEEVYKNPETGRWIKSGRGLRIGDRDEYYDFSF